MPRLDPALPNNAALFLDLDGTLLEFAPTPGAVVVPEGLIPTLITLRERLGGALAIVSGRPVGQIDDLLRDAPTAVAGEHGAAIRHTPNGPIERATVAPVPPEWRAVAEHLATKHPGALFEPKIGSFVLHYRRAPEAAEALRMALATLLDGHGDRFHLVASAMAWEIRPLGADKGAAVRVLMARAPFLGRRPVYVGDDVTDEDGIRAATDLGGKGYRVSEAFGKPADVRAWLESKAGAPPLDAAKGRGP